MTVHRTPSIFAAAALALGTMAITPQAGTAQAAAPSAMTAPQPTSNAQADTAGKAGPRLAPRWEPTPVLLPGQTAEREINAAARGQTITIPVVTLLLGIIILILLVG